MLKYNYQTDPDRVQHNKRLEAYGKSRRFWQAVQIIGIVVLLAAQVTFLYFDVLPSQDMMFWPLIVIAWSLLFIPQIIWQGRQVTRYLDAYYEKQAPSEKEEHARRRSNGI